MKKTETENKNKAWNQIASLEPTGPSPPQPSIPPPGDVTWKPSVVTVVQ